VSLDALDPEIFARMNGVGAKVERVLAGISAAQAFGLPVKVNAVIQRGVNEVEILPLARWAKSAGVDLRYIEYMDVGETNGWKLGEVVSGDEILSILAAEFPLVPRDPAYRGEVAVHWSHGDGAGEIGLIRSVTRPFCATPISPPSGPTQWLFQGPPTESKFLAAKFLAAPPFPRPPVRPNGSFRGLPQKAKSLQP
jgi:cyclic pyranopterin phosphate synthase